MIPHFLRMMWFYVKLGHFGFQMTSFWAKIRGRNFRVVVKFLLSKTFQNIIITTFRVESFTMKDVKGVQCPEINIFDHFFKISKILWNFHFLRPRDPRPGGYMSPGFFVYNLCKNPEESLIIIIDVISLFWLFRVWSFYIESKTRLREDIISIYHDISHIFHNNSTFHLGRGKKRFQRTVNQVNKVFWWFCAPYRWIFYYSP